MNCEHIKQWSERHHDEVADPALYANGWWVFACVKCGRQFDYCAAWLGLKGLCKCGRHTDKVKAIT